MFDERDILRRGEKLQEQKDYDRAIEAFSEAIGLNPKYTEAYFARGKRLRRKRLVRQGG